MEKALSSGRSKVYPLVLCALFAALISAGVFVVIPFYPVPFTLQTVFVTLSGLLLGKKYGTVSVLVFIVLGLTGLPVFTGGGGIGYILKPTFGYIIGYAFAAFLIGAVAHSEKNPSFIRLVAASLIGTAALYLVGMVWLFLSMNLWTEGSGITVTGVIMTGFVPTILKDILLCGILCPMLAKKLIPILSREFKVQANGKAG